MTTLTVTTLSQVPDKATVYTIFNIFSMTQPGCELDSPSTEKVDATTTPYQGVLCHLDSIIYSIIPSSILVKKFSWLY